MDTNRFDETFRTFVSNPFRSRRRLLAGLTCGLLATVPYHLGGEDAEAKNKHKKGKKKKKTPPSQPQPQPLSPPEFNAFGCLDVGQPCQGDGSLCCSGTCDGKAPTPGQPDTSVCVAHNSGICFADSNSCEGGAVQCNPNKPNCLCTLTTGNAGFCADLSGVSEFADLCRFCSTDTDCEAEFGSGAACIVFNGICTPLCAATGRTACAPPCA